VKYCSFQPALWPSSAEEDPLQLMKAIVLAESYNISSMFIVLQLMKATVLAESYNIS
jgi:hypothetical protein